MMLTVSNELEKFHIYVKLEFYLSKIHTMTTKVRRGMLADRDKHKETKGRDILLRSEHERIIKDLK